MHKIFDRNKNSEKLTYLCGKGGEKLNFGSSSYYSYGCDKCGDVCSGDRWHCSIHGYDLCTTCAPLDQTCNVTKINQNSDESPHSEQYNVINVSPSTSRPVYICDKGGEELEFGEWDCDDYKCDKCGEHCSGKRWHCDNHDYDLCHSCAPPDQTPNVTKINQNANLVPHQSVSHNAVNESPSTNRPVYFCGTGGEKLKFEPYNSSNYNCDKCGKHINGYLWHCYTHDYELCSSCAPNDQTLNDNKINQNANRAPDPHNAVDGSPVYFCKRNGEKLIYQKLKYKDYYCNKCGESDRGKRWCCANCNYDLCSDCAPPPE